VSVGTVVFFVLGIAILVAGADALVRGAARIAARTGVSSVVIGLTVVAFGTSAPELAVSVQSAIDRKTDLAIGNVVGSNIANILLVLGLSAAVGGGLLVHQRIVRLDVPIMIVVSVAFFILVLDGELGRLDGALLTVALIVYVTWTVLAARRSEAEVTAEYDEALDPEKVKRTPPGIDVACIVGGLVGLVLGARFLVSSAVEIAEALGVSDLVIGLTVVAVGTSMPEIATSIVAAIKGERDLAVGNAIGSNLFNILCVLGLSSLVAPVALTVAENAKTLDVPVMIAVAVACLPVFFNGYQLKRWEGILFVAYYAAYVVYLVANATESEAKDLLGTAVVWFVIPLTVLTFVVVGYRAASLDRAERTSTS
jgi:cation:H+ antiporter